MPSVRFEGQAYPLETGESVLDCLLRHQQSLAHSCKSGLCQSCLVQAVDSMPPAKAFNGLKPTLQATRHALACQWQPDGDVAIRLPASTDLDVEGTIAELQLLNPAVMRVRVKPANAEALADCRPGQFLTLTNAARVTRSYSVANDIRTDGVAEFHIASTAQGLFSSWIFQHARAGDSLSLRGPAGACFYVAEQTQEQPLLLAGTGTGLAPLWGIVHDALRQQHRGPITLLHAATTPAHLYYRHELRALAQAHRNFRYHAVIKQGPADDDSTEADAIATALALLPAERMADTRLYLCGNPLFVSSLRKQAFLKGLRSAHIYSDPFVERSIA